MKTMASGPSRSRRQFSPKASIKASKAKAPWAVKERIMQGLSKRSDKAPDGHYRAIGGGARRGGRKKADLALTLSKARFYLHIGGWAGE